MKPKGYRVKNRHVKVHFHDLAEDEKPRVDTSGLLNDYYIFDFKTFFFVIKKPTVYEYICTYYLNPSHRCIGIGHYAFTNGVRL
jgi:hypothetical protein